MSKSIFVFGSNEAGIHGAGAARAAYEKHGARWGFSYGHMGDSFAIPTKGKVMVRTRVAAADGKNEGWVIGDTLELGIIRRYVDGFLAYANGHPEFDFQVTRIGCGLAGLRDEDIAPMFTWAGNNCLFDEAWSLYHPKHRTWGTY